MHLTLHIEYTVFEVNKHITNEAAELVILRLSPPLLHIFSNVLILIIETAWTVAE